jgi:competence protein ComEC
MNALAIISLLAILLAAVLTIRKKHDWKKWLALSIVFVLLIAGIANIIPAEQAQATPGQQSQQVESTSSKLKVHFIDVGQGDSILVQFHNNQTMLIDAGTSSASSTVVSYLKQQGVNTIDYLVATHPHEDHIGGMIAVVNEFDINKVYMPKAVHTTQTYEDLLLAIQSKGLTITPARAGLNIIEQGSLKVNFIAPCGTNYDNVNNYSAVVKIQYGSTSFLLTGDAEDLSEGEMLASGANLQADVLKVGHHGSSSSTTPSFLKAVSPKYAVISCGAGNQYGHPHQVTLDKLTNAGAEIYRTDIHGTIIFVSDGKTLTIETLANTIKPRAPNTRLAGRTRYETSKVVAEEYNSGQVDNIVLATGNGFADALSVSTLAGKLNAPILLVNQTTSKSPEALDYISKHMSSGKVWIAGGTGVVDTTFESKLSSMGNSVERVEGRTRYDTCLAIADKVNAPKGTPIFIVSGENFPDALSVASVAAEKGYPIILTQKDNLPDGVAGYLSKQQPSEVFIIGGTGVISPTVESKIKSTLPGKTITRLGGQNRFDTSVTVYKKFFPNPSNIFIVSGMDFADALSASVLAAKYNAPIVLINPKLDYPPESTAAYLKTLDNPNVTVIGGTGVVPVQLVNNIKDILANKTSVTVTKTWVGSTGTATFHLYADGVDTGKTLILSGNTSGSFDNLPKYTSSGRDILYTVTEDPVANYDTKVSGNAEMGYSFTNTKKADVYNYIGNKNTKKFHKPTCSSLPAEQNRVYFSTREEAIAEGYTPCKICKP